MKFCGILSSTLLQATLLKLCKLLRNPSHKLHINLLLRTGVFPTVQTMEMFSTLFALFLDTVLFIYPISIHLLLKTTNRSSYTAYKITQFDNCLLVEYILHTA